LSGGIEPVFRAQRHQLQRVSTFYAANNLRLKTRARGAE
jgi:hypothetical protein